MNARVRSGLWVLNGALYVLGAGQHGLGQWDKNWGCYSVYATGLTKALRLPLSSGNCSLKMLAKGFQPTRLETRTKESNMYASWWVENP